MKHKHSCLKCKVTYDCVAHCHQVPPRCVQSRAYSGLKLRTPWVQILQALYNCVSFIWRIAPAQQYVKDELRNGEFTDWYLAESRPLFGKFRPVGGYHEWMIEKDK